MTVTNESKMHDCFCRDCGKKTGSQTSDVDAVKIFQCFDCFITQDRGTITNKNKLGQAHLYNDCNPRDDSYCMFEKDYKDLKERILSVGNQIELEDLQRELKRNWQSI